MLRAELAKSRYLPLPRWTAAAVMAAAVVTGAALIIFRPHNPDSYISISSDTVNQVLDLGAMVFGVWVAALEFSSGTLQRTLTAEPDRRRVLGAKLLTALLGTLILAAFAAATVGGLTHLAIIRADVPVGAGDLARAVFAVIPDALFSAAIGFGFGLLVRSMAGGITFALVFLLVLSGVLSLIPGLEKVSYGQASSDVTAGIGHHGSTTHGIGASIGISLIWIALIVVPGWIRFLRSDVK